MWGSESGGEAGAEESPPGLWEWPMEGRRWRCEEALLRVWDCSSSQADDADDEEALSWPRDVLAWWDKPLLCVASTAHCTATALLGALAASRAHATLYITQLSFSAALAAAPVGADPANILLAASVGPARWVPESREPLTLLVDGWMGDLAPLREFLSRHCVHVGMRSERYATEHKAGIGADESSSEAPLPRFLGSTRNDTWACTNGGEEDGVGVVVVAAVPLAGLVLATHPSVWEGQKLERWFTRIAVGRPHPSALHALVRRMGCDCPGARNAPDAWSAFLCGVAAGLPPPAEPEGARRLLSTVSGAFGHLCASVPRHLLLCAGLVAVVTLASQTPLDLNAQVALCALYLAHQRDPSQAELPPAALLADCRSALAGLCSPAHPGLLVFGHAVVAHWLAAQYLAVEDAATERALQAAARAYPSLQEVGGPLTQQQLPFVYSPQCAASPRWREVLHFLGVTSGVYALAYRLCAWGDNSNIAAYQWLLQLKSQSCSPMHHPRKVPPRPAPPLFEYHLHGDVGRVVFWILCRVQAELSVSSGGPVAPGEESAFPHFVRAVLATPRHAHDLVAALEFPVVAAAVARLHDGPAIGQHLAELCAEVAVARPWAAPHYARKLRVLFDEGLLPAGFGAGQARALSASKSTSKRLLGAAWVRVAGIQDEAALRALVGGGADRSSFVRDECLAAMESLLCECSPPWASSLALRALLLPALRLLAEQLREATPPAVATACLTAAWALLKANHPLAPAALVLGAGAGEGAALSVRLGSALAAMGGVGLCGMQCWGGDASVATAAMACLGPLPHLLDRHPPFAVLLLEAQPEPWPLDDPVMRPLLGPFASAAALYSMALQSGDDDAASWLWRCPLRTPEQLVGLARTKPAWVGPSMASLRSLLGGQGWWGARDGRLWGLEQILLSSENTEALLCMVQCHAPLSASAAVIVMERVSSLGVAAGQEALSALHSLCSIRCIVAPADETECTTLVQRLAQLASTTTLPLPLRQPLVGATVLVAASLGAHARRWCLQQQQLDEWGCAVLCRGMPAQEAAQVDAAALVERSRDAPPHVRASTLQLAAQLIAGGSPHHTSLLPTALAICLDSLPQPPLVRRAAGELALQCANCGQGEWVALVAEEVANRASAPARPEEPGLVAGLALVRRGMSAPGAAARASMLANTWASLLDKRWNASVIAGAAGVLGCLARHPQHCAVAAPLLLGPAMATHAAVELREAALKAVRAMDGPAIAAGLRALGLGSEVRKSPSAKLVALFRDDSSNGNTSNSSSGGSEEAVAQLVRLHERAASGRERMALLELACLVAFRGAGGEGAAAKVEGVVCEALRVATAAQSGELSTLVARHAQLFLPHVWAMLAQSTRSRSVANKWLTFLRKHYQGDATLHSRALALSAPPMAEVAAALRGFAAAVGGGGSSGGRGGAAVDASLSLRLLGVLHECVNGATPHPSLFSACVGAAQAAVNALTDASAAQAAAEQKETALLLVVRMLGRWAAVAGPPNSHWYEFLRPLLEGLPYGLGREVWRLLQSSAGHLLF